MNAIQTLASLGGARALGAEVESEIGLVALIERGLPPATADHLARLGDLSEAELGEIIPRRTLAHARRRDRLSPEQSDRIVRAAGTYTRAHEVFGDRAKANRWMRRPNRALEGKTPLSLLRTSRGTELVETVLDRIVFLIAWRLCTTLYPPLTGEGARKRGGRWNSPGVPLVYLSEHCSLAALEVLVHLESDDLPDTLAAYEVEIPDDAFEHRGACHPPGSPIRYGARAGVSGMPGRAKGARSRCSPPPP